MVELLEFKSYVIIFFQVTIHFRKSPENDKIMLPTEGSGSITAITVFRCLSFDFFPSLKLHKEFRDLQSILDTMVLILGLKQ